MKRAISLKLINTVWSTATQIHKLHKMSAGPNAPRVAKEDGLENRNYIQNKEIKIFLRRTKKSYIQAELNPSRLPKDDNLENRNPCRTDI